MIQFKNVKFKYNDKDVLKDISFHIPKGKYTCIIGHNGSGKSTIAKLMLGLIEKDEGEIYIDELKLDHENIDEIRSKLGIVFQNPDNQFIATTVEDDIAFTLENACYPQEEMQKIIEKYAEKVGMLQYLKHEPEKLSGGQKQRVALASVLAGRSEVIIFDEATSMLDPIGKKEVLSLINEIHETQNKTIISITHDMDELQYADYIIALNKGTIIYEGEIKNIYQNLHILSRLPFVLELQQYAKQIGFHVEETFDLEEVVNQICQSK